MSWPILYWGSFISGNVRQSWKLQNSNKWSSKYTFQLARWCADGKLHIQDSLHVLFELLSLRAFYIQLFLSFRSESWVQAIIIFSKVEMCKFLKIWFNSNRGSPPETFCEVVLLETPRKNAAKAINFSQVKLYVNWTKSQLFSWEPRDTVRTAIFKETYKRVIHILLLSAFWTAIFHPVILVFTISSCANFLEN